MPKVMKVHEHVKSSAQLSVKVMIRYQMGRRRLNYAGLTELLNKAGVEENERNLANKVGRGELPGWLFLLCMKLMGVESLALAEWPMTESELGTLLQSGAAHAKT